MADRICFIYIGKRMSRIFSRLILSVFLNIFGLLSTVLSHEALTPISSIHHVENNFNFDWNNYKTIESSAAKIGEIETFLAAIGTLPPTSPADQHALGKLLYKLGTFYMHVAQETDAALKKLKQAEEFLTEAHDRAWNYNHLAFAYEKKYSISGQLNDKDMAMTYLNKVLVELYPHQSNKETAFAYCVQGLVHNDAKDYIQAEASFRKALAIYEQLPNGTDDQYARAKNRLAHIILDQNDRDQEALIMLESLKKYWLSKEGIKQSPYAARNAISLGQAYLKIGNKDAARQEFNTALHIYKSIYGSTSPLLERTKQLLANIDKN